MDGLLLLHCLAASYGSMHVSQPPLHDSSPKTLHGDANMAYIHHPATSHVLPWSGFMAPFG